MSRKTKSQKGNPDINKQELLRNIPKVDEVLDWVTGEVNAPAKLVKSSVREILAEYRQDIISGSRVDKSELSKTNLLPVILKRLDVKLGPNLKTVINATGVVIHTNLGRSVLPSEAIKSLTQAGAHYSNLEFDLESGERGSRYSLIEEILCELTSAEAALAVNNNAAAVLLVLDSMANGREVIVSRGQLVEIGGSFRVPEVMKKSGAKLVEVGATNRTHLKDYVAAINEDTAMLLKVHTSNFRQIGFTAEVPLEDLVKLGQDNNIVVMEDLGSGSLLDLSKYGLNKEPTVGEIISKGVDVVTFSGDKLLGGPQAGIILGKKKIIDLVKKNQLTRALRIDKFTLASLETVLRFYFEEETVLQKLPTLSMLTMPIEAIEKRGRELLSLIQNRLTGKCKCSLVKVYSRVGGGAMPEQDLPSYAVSLESLDRKITKLERKLRTDPGKQLCPVIGRIEDDNFLLDMRTVADDDIPVLADCLLYAFEENPS